MFKDSKTFSSFSVDDLAKAKEFYGQTLGLNVTDNPMGLLDVHLAQGGEAMIYPKNDHAPASFTVLNFIVENIDGVAEELVSAGVQFEHYEDMGMDEKNISRGIPNGQGPNIAWFKDPAGNVLSVLEVQ